MELLASTPTSANSLKSEIQIQNSFEPTIIDRRDSGILNCVNPFMLIGFPRPIDNRRASTFAATVTTTYNNHGERRMSPRRNPIIAALLNRLRALRERAGISPETLEEQMILGPGWVERFESGQTVPTFDMILAILGQIGGTPADLLGDIASGASVTEVEREIYAVPSGSDLTVKFRYAKHDAEYHLRQATIDEFERVIKTLRDGLSLLKTRNANSESIKTQAVASAFLEAVRIWPHANPSDIWWFIVYRAYCDPFNHPADFARLDLSQSWKRTAGWALEEVLVRHYNPFLVPRGVELVIAYGPQKDALLSQLRVEDRLEADKVDVFLVGRRNDERVCFGVIHVKASFAERRTDDVPMSKALVEAGYVSPLWTMDCKSTPSETPINKGELGLPRDVDAQDRRSAKRKDIEDDGYFSACFSYNQNTMPTPAPQRTRARIIVCNFRSPEDEFSRFILEQWAAHNQA